MACFCTSNVSAQQGGPNAAINAGQGLLNAGSNDTGTFGAQFADFDDDMQFFAPFEDSDLLNPRRQSLGGYYAAYERNWKSVQRPSVQGTTGLTAFPTGSDFVTGNNFRFGYTDNIGNGWAVDYERLSGSFFSGGTSDIISRPMMTTTSISDVSFKKIFRQNLSTGGFIEPYVGVRYMNFGDTTIHDTNTLLVDVVDPNDPTDDTIVLGDNRFEQDVTNNAVGGTAGFRYTVRQGRIGLQSNFGFSGFYNQQNYKASNTALFRDPTSLFADGSNVNVGEITDSSNSFVPMVEFSLMGTYGITKNLSLRAGGSVNYVWDGLTRANTLVSQVNPFSGGAGSTAIEDQDAFIGGFSIGLQWSK